VPPNPAHKLEAQQWASTMLSKPSSSWCILDTETTGLEGLVLQIGILAPTGLVLLDALVHQPKVEPKAQEVHGISAEMLWGAASWRNVWLAVREILRTREVVIYNAAFDLAVLERTCKFSGFEFVTPHHHCAMLQNAAYQQEWNEYRNAYRWPKLGGGDHSAIGDCRATLELIHRMAEGL